MPPVHAGGQCGSALSGGISWVNIERNERPSVTRKHKNRSKNRWGLFSCARGTAVGEPFVPALALSKFSRRRKITSERIRRFRRQILGWYAGNGRSFPWRQSRNPYQRVISEVLLQRTRAETVATYFPQFAKRFPSWESLAAASSRELRRLIGPLGLWRTRVPVLKSLAAAVLKNNSVFSRRRSEIERLPGVGQYVGNAIGLFYLNRREPLLDASMARLLERYFGPRRMADIRYDPYLQELARKVVNTRRATDMNWAILDFAALVCRPKFPKCDICPLKAGCNFKRTASQRSSD